jgi:hypothetical protein
MQIAFTEVNNFYKSKEERKTVTEMSAQPKPAPTKAAHAREFEKPKPMPSDVFNGGPTDAIALKRAKGGKKKQLKSASPRKARQTQESVSRESAASSTATATKPRLPFAVQNGLKTAQSMFVCPNPPTDNHSYGQETFTNQYMWYSGSTLENEPDGVGNIIYLKPAIETYEGAISKGQRDGHGLMVYSNGSFYIGSWKNGAKHGMGRLQLPDGTVVEGLWNDD